MGSALNPRLRPCLGTITKEQRLQIRVDPSDKALLERAAAASHLNVSSFVVQAAALKAEEVPESDRPRVVDPTGFQPLDQADPDQLDLYLLTSAIKATLKAL